jgi:hypothetical protein
MNFNKNLSKKLAYGVDTAFQNNIINRKMHSDSKFFSISEHVMSSHIPINAKGISQIIDNQPQKTNPYYPIKKNDDKETNLFLSEIIHRIDIITKEIKELKSINEEVIREIKELKSINEEVIVVRELSRDEAKKEIKKLFEDNDGKSLDYGDIMRELKLDLKLVVELCSELAKEGEIG